MSRISCTSPLFFYLISAQFNFALLILIPLPYLKLIWVEFGTRLQYPFFPFLALAFALVHLVPATFNLTMQEKRFMGRTELFVTKVMEMKSPWILSTIEKKPVCSCHTQSPLFFRLIGKNSVGHIYSQSTEALSTLSYKNNLSTLVVNSTNKIQHKCQLTFMFIYDKSVITNMNIKWYIFWWGQDMKPLLCKCL